MPFRDQHFTSHGPITEHFLKFWPAANSNIVLMGRVWLGPRATNQNSVFLLMISVSGSTDLTASSMPQIVLLKDQKKCFSIDNPGYEPEVVAVHPGGDTVAVGGTVRPLSFIQ